MVCDALPESSPPGAAASPKHVGAPVGPLNTVLSSDYCVMTIVWHRIALCCHGQGVHMITETALNEPWKEGEVTILTSV